AALREFWTDDRFAADVRRKADMVRSRLHAIAQGCGTDRLSVRGRGLMQGLACAEPSLATAISREAFRRGLIIETSGPHDEVLKCLCPLVIDDEELELGLQIIEESAVEALRASARQTARKAV